MSTASAAAAPAIQSTISGAAAVLDLVRTRRPLVHCLTNDVTMGRVADALAAVGALPVMASAPEEAADMAAHAQALVLNLGTPSSARWAAARGAGERAAASGIPVVADPVGCGATPWRTDQARALLAALRVSLVRGNAPEVAALAAVPLPQTLALRGVTAVGQDTVDGLEALATAASRALGTAVLVTGRQNVLVSGTSVTRHTTGVAALERVVGGGDVLTALCAACLAVTTDVLTGTLAGLAMFTAAARVATAHARGPGTFWPAMLDALASMAPEQLTEAEGQQ